MGKQKLSEVRRQEFNALSAQLQALHEDAGIASEIRKTDDPHVGTRHTRSDRDRRLTRAAYFGVADIELRKRLIKLKRERDEAALALYRAEYGEEHKRVRDIAEKARLWAIPAAVCSVILVFVGHGYFGVPGAVAGGTLGVIFAMHSRDADERLRLVELERARAYLNVCELLVTGEPQIFTNREADTGEPDSAPGRLMERAFV